MQLSESVMRDCLVSHHHSSFACGSCARHVSLSTEASPSSLFSTFGRIFDVRSARVAMCACSLLF
jgi:hypothetical protein